MTVASLTVTSTKAHGGNPATGRNIYVEGNRYVGRFRLTLKDLYETGGGSLAFDPQTYGFPGSPAEVRFTHHLTVANVLLRRYDATYDYVNKKILLFDTVDGDEPNTDDVTGLAFDVLVVGE